MLLNKLRKSSKENQRKRVTGNWPMSPVLKAHLDLSFLVAYTEDAKKFQSNMWNFESLFPTKRDEGLILYNDKASFKLAMGLELIIQEALNQNRVHKQKSRA